MKKLRALLLPLAAVGIISTTACRPIEVARYINQYGSTPVTDHVTLWVKPGGEPNDLGWFIVEAVCSGGSYYSPTYDINNIPGHLQRGPNGEVIVTVLCGDHSQVAYNARLITAYQ